MVPWKVSTSLEREQILNESEVLPHLPVPTKTTLIYQNRCPHAHLKELSEQNGTEVWRISGVARRARLGGH